MDSRCFHGVLINGAFLVPLSCFCDETILVSSGWPWCFQRAPMSGPCWVRGSLVGPWWERRRVRRGSVVGPWCCGGSMVRPWCFHDWVHVGFKWLIHVGGSLVCPWCFLGGSMVPSMLPWCFHGASVGLSWRVHGVVPSCCVGHGNIYQVYEVVPVVYRHVCGTANMRCHKSATEVS